MLSELDEKGWPRGLIKEVGLKSDSGKLQWHLFPWRAAACVVEVLMFGAKKYGPGNWRKVDNAVERYYDAAIRHLAAYSDGEDYDRDSGLMHLAHAACSLLFMLWFETKGD